MGIRRLVFRLILFLLPFILTVSGAIALGVVSGQAMPLAQIFALQDNDPQVVYLPRSRDLIFRYKQYGIAHTRPDILIIGTSVTRYVRADLFSADTRFYNAFAPGMRSNELSDLMRQFTPESAPRVLIIGLDLPRLSLRDLTNSKITAGMVDLSPSEILLYTREMLVEVLTGRQTIPQILSSNAGADSRRLGLTATLEGRGFRFDGSTWNHTDAVALQARTKQETIQLERDRYVTLVAGGERVMIDQSRADRLLQDVRDLELMGVQVVGIVMPLTMPSVMSAISDTPYESDIRQSLRMLTEGFIDAGAELYEYLDPRPLGITDDDMPDATHTSEEVTAWIVRDMQQQSPSLQPYALIAVADGTVNK